MGYRVWNLIVKELIQLWRDRLLVLFITLGPVMELVLVAWATSGEIERIPTAIVDLDRSPASRSLVQALDNSRTFDPRFYPDDVEAAQDLVERGRTPVAVLIPPDFQERLDDPARGPAYVQVILDGAEASVAQTALLSAEGVVGSYAQTQMETRRGQVAALSVPLPALELRVRTWFNEALKLSYYEVPSELGFMLIGVALMISSLGIARERELGTLEQLLVTPMRGIELVIGKAVPAIVLAYVDFLLMLGLVLYLFHIPMRGSFALLLTIALFYLLVEIGWGLMISAISRTQWQALLLVFSLMMGEMIFSGYASPVENMPWLLRNAANLVPIKHWLIILRSILLKGAGVEVFWRELLALAGLGVVINLLTLTVLRRRLE